MKRLLTMICMGAAALAFADVEWKGLSEDNWYSGRKLTPEDLKGKVVLVDEWGVHCGPCLALLPKMEQVWRSFKSKPFILLGSHRQGRQVDAVAACVKKNNLTYPIFDHAGLADEPGNGGAIPFLYVVDSRGKVVFSGRGMGAEQGAIAAVVNALSDVDGPETLCGNVELVKFKSMKRQLQLGVPCEGAVRQLKAVVKAKGKPEVVLEATKILEAVAKTHDEMKESIADQIKSRPATALVQMDKFRKTWPSEAKDYDADFKRLAADPDVLKCAKLRKATEKWRTYDPRNVFDAKRSLASVQSELKGARAFVETAQDGVASEAKSCIEELEEIEKEFTGLANPPKKVKENNDRRRDVNDKRKESARNRDSSRDKPRRK